MGGVNSSLSKHITIALIICPKQHCLLCGLGESNVHERYDQWHFGYWEFSIVVLDTMLTKQNTAN